MTSWTDIPAEVLAVLRKGAVLPAHPLALDAERQFDRESQRALARYYIDAGAGGLAVGVHATQFAIREAGLYRPVLELAAETAAAGQRRRADRALPERGAGAARDRLLSACRRRRHGVVAQLLDAFCRHRQCDCHQGRPLRSLQDARCGLRRGRRRGGGSPYALHGQRRPHYRRPRHPDADWHARARGGLALQPAMYWPRHACACSSRQCHGAVRYHHHERETDHEDRCRHLECGEDPGMCSWRRPRAALPTGMTGPPRRADPESSRCARRRATVTSSSSPFITTTAVARDVVTGRLHKATKTKAGIKISPAPKGWTKLEGKRAETIAS